ncbi:hypothetical protein MPSEU_000119100 [Mayamaea pseudoterrestris]|nr:hypothetical protein MPSEU_000119100 [Mayamaea pseudoterrestris]
MKSTIQLLLCSSLLVIESSQGHSSANLRGQGTIDMDLAAEHDWSQDDAAFHNFHPKYIEQETLAGRTVDLDAMPCATESPTHDEMSLMNKAVTSWKQDFRNRNRRLAATSYDIQVYMHIIKKSQQEGDLSKNSQRKFLRKLNNKFSATPFTFTLANVDRIVNENWHLGQDESGFKAALRVNGTNVLNVYVLNTNAKAAGTIGYSYFPPIVYSGANVLDGVVIMNPDIQVNGAPVFNSLAVLNGLVHEVGHWFGLAHTFEGGCSAQVIDQWKGQADYQIRSDGISDTAAHAGPTYARRDGFNTCWQNMQIESCSGVAGVDRGYEPVDNMMNVIPGPCYEKYGRFTSGQVERMLIQYETFRLANA